MPEEEKKKLDTLFIETHEAQVDGGAGEDMAPITNLEIDIICV